MSGAAEQEGAARHATRATHPVAWTLGIAAVVLLLVFGTDYFTIGRPVQIALASDPRNAGFDLSVHRQYRVTPGVLVISLARVDSAAPIDLMRGIFVTAEALHDAGRRFDRVVLARGGRPVFVLHGAYFAELGAEYGSGQNPLYLVRTLPEKLYTPDGQPAYGAWTGGIFGVLGQQMGDVSTSMNRWVSGDN